MAEEEMTLKVEEATTIGALLGELSRTAGWVLLYPAEGVQHEGAGGPHLLTLPRDRLFDGVRLLLSLRGLEIRRFGDSPSLVAVVARERIRPEYRAPGIEEPLLFNRPPPLWERERDLADSLSAEAVQLLLGILAQVDAEELPRGTAATLLGRLGPRSPELVGALTLALDAPAEFVKLAAAGALAEMGFSAREALPRLAALAEERGGAFRVAADRVRDAPHPALLAPGLAREQAPAKFRVRLTTTQGQIVIECERSVAPFGVDRFFNLVAIGYFKDVAFFRVLPRFVAQWGIHGDPRVDAAWREQRIDDDPPALPNQRGTVVFATQSGKAKSRTCQLFVNTADNSKSLDPLGFTPIGRVIEGMEIVERLHAGYGDGPPTGRGPHQGRFHSEGNAYTKAEFPKLDYLLRAEIE